MSVNCFPFHSSIKTLLSMCVHFLSSLYTDHLELVMNEVYLPLMSSQSSSQQKLPNDKLLDLMHRLVGAMQVTKGYRYVDNNKYMYMHVLVQTYIHICISISSAYFTSSAHCLNVTCNIVSMSLPQHQMILSSQSGSHERDFSFNVNSHGANDIHSCLLAVRDEWSFPCLRLKSWLMLL